MPKMYLNLIYQEKSFYLKAPHIIRIYEYYHFKECIQNKIVQKHFIPFNKPHFGENTKIEEKVNDTIESIAVFDYFYIVR